MYCQWEFDPEFDKRLQAHFNCNRQDLPECTVRWVNWMGEPCGSSKGETATDDCIQKIIHGEAFGHPSDLIFRDPNSFRAGELHAYYPVWEKLAGPDPTPQQVQVLQWIRERVSVFDYFQHFRGTFKRNQYDSPRPPSCHLKNNISCKQFATFVKDTLIDRLATGAIILKGKVGVVDPPHLVMPLTVEPQKPRLCYDARFLNLWMKDAPFTLDTLSDLPRYVTSDTYQSVLDDKSGYYHILLHPDSLAYFGIQWGGWYFLHVSLPFGWKIYKFTTLLDCSRQVFSARSAFHACYILMIAIMANCKFHLNTEYIVSFLRLTHVISLPQILLCFLWHIFLFALAIFLD